MSSPEQAARRLLDSISEPLDCDPGKLARVARQFITLERAPDRPASPQVGFQKKM